MMFGITERFQNLRLSAPVHLNGNGSLSRTKQLLSAPSLLQHILLRSAREAFYLAL